MTKVVITASQYSVTLTVTCKQQCPHEGDWGLNNDTVQLVQLLKSINIPIESAQADEMEEVIHSAGLQMQRVGCCTFLM